MNRPYKVQVVGLDPKDFIIEFKEFAQHENRKMASFIKYLLERNDVRFVRITKWAKDS